MSYPDPADARLPMAIKRLGPCNIVLEDDYVRVVLCTRGGGRVDIIGFRDGATDKELDGGIGKGQRLVPGLWLYENWGE